MRVLLVGGGAREHIIGEKLLASGQFDLFTLTDHLHPVLSRVSTLILHDEADIPWISHWAEQHAIDLAIIGGEAPLAAGLTDALENLGIPTVGPTQAAAQLETSKLFLRQLMARYLIAGRVAYHHATDLHQLARLLDSDTLWVLKPLGLTSGKGVKVMGVHLDSPQDAYVYGRSLLSTGLILEERLVGKEFSLQAFCDGKNLRPMPLVRDYKLVYDGDLGPNTGSMGSYSQADGLLPFVKSRDRDHALTILQVIMDQMAWEHHPYRGIIYGQFMQTTDGPKLVEINARFGDPEALNVLSLLETDFVTVCQAITQGTLADIEITFMPRATVCTYLVPPGYPLEPKIGVPILVDFPRIESLGVSVYYGKMNRESEDTFLTTRSRSIVLIGTDETIQGAKAKVDAAMGCVSGDYHARTDIGTLA